MPTSLRAFAGTLVLLCVFSLGESAAANGRAWRVPQKKATLTIRTKGTMFGGKVRVHFVPAGKKLGFRGRLKDDPTNTHGRYLLQYGSFGRKKITLEPGTESNHFRSGGHSVFARVSPEGDVVEVQTAPIPGARDNTTWTNATDTMSWQGDGWLHTNQRTMQIRDGFTGFKAALKSDYALSRRVKRELAKMLSNSTGTATVDNVSAIVQQGSLVIEQIVGTKLKLKYYNRPPGWGRFARSWGRLKRTSSLDASERMNLNMADLVQMPPENGDAATDVALTPPLTADELARAADWL
jgi:hypothetical protein